MSIFKFIISKNTPYLIDLENSLIAKGILKCKVKEYIRNSIENRINIDSRYFLPDEVTVDLVSNEIIRLTGETDAILIRKIIELTYTQNRRTEFPDFPELYKALEIFQYKSIQIYKFFNKAA